MPSEDHKPVQPGLTARLRKSFLPKGKFSLDVDFRAAPGFTIIVGRSGSGKTSLLNCLAGLSTPDAGRVTIGQRLLFDDEARTDVPIAKRGVGYVLQDLALFPHLTVQQNAEYGLTHLSRVARKERSSAMLREFRIEQLHARRPREISGGERQRAALVRSLVTDPCMLLLDEPLAALDQPTKSKIIDDLRRWNEAHRIPILYVTHSREEVMALGEAALVIDEGRIVAQGTPHQVLSAPIQESVAQLAGFENIFDATVESVHAERGTLTGRLLDPAAKGSVVIELPMIRPQPGTGLRVGIRAGDILLAITKPVGLSARNVLPGCLASLQRRDMMVVARVRCGVEMEVHLTLAACDDLRLESGNDVWLVIKTHSCHLLQA